MPLIQIPSQITLISKIEMDLLVIQQNSHGKKRDVWLQNIPDDIHRAYSRLPHAKIVMETANDEVCLRLEWTGPEVVELCKDAPGEPRQAIYRLIEKAAKTVLAGKKKKA